MYQFEAEAEKKLNKAARIKTIKQVEKGYSKELINTYKQEQKEKENEAEFKNVVNFFLNKA
jgi:uncharacterized protein YlbG (UPF0298 family)